MRETLLAVEKGGQAEACPTGFVGGDTLVQGGSWAKKECTARGSVEVRM